MAALSQKRTAPDEEARLQPHLDRYYDHYEAIMQERATCLADVRIKLRVAAQFKEGDPIADEDAQLIASDLMRLMGVALG